jgi:hypothetical protein
MKSHLMIVTAGLVLTAGIAAASADMLVIKPADKPR